MSSPSSGKPRRVVPRWRDFPSTVRLGELVQSRPLLQAQPTHSSLQAAIEDHSTFAEWLANPSTWNGLDLIGAAAATGEQSKIADLADQVVARPGIPLLIKKLSSRLLKPECPVRIPPELLITDRKRHEISGLRRRLTSFPRDPVQWVELARAYTIAGVFPHAQRAIRAAIALAPTNRFVLRSAAAFFMQWNDPEQAQSVVFRQANSTEDPWLISVEVTAATLAARSSNLVKLGKRVAQASRQPSQISELASAIGTLEFESGSDRAGRKLIGLSLAEPNENSLAQAEWLNQNSLHVPFDTSNASPPLNHEAQVQVMQAAGLWKEATLHSLKWWMDQPFAASAAIACSFLLGDVAGHTKWAATIAEQGLAANPDDIFLKNNLAFNLIRNGELDRAERVLQDAKYDSFGTIGSVLEATWGALSYAKGDSEGGRARYLESLRLAQGVGDKVTAARSAIYHATEEFRANSATALMTLKTAVELSGNINDPLVEFQAMRLISEAKKSA